MFATKKETNDWVSNLHSLIDSNLRLTEMLSKRLDYAIQRIAYLEGRNKEVSEFLDKMLKSLGMKFEYTPPKVEQAKYEIVKVKGAK